MSAQVKRMEFPAEALPIYEPNERRVGYSLNRETSKETAVQFYYLKGGRKTRDILYSGRISESESGFTISLIFLLTGATVWTRTDPATFERALWLLCRSRILEHPPRLAGLLNFPRKNARATP